MDFLKEMDFKVVSSPLSLHKDDPTNVLGLYEKRAIYRGDTKQLLGITSDNYLPIQNKDITDIVVPEIEKFSVDGSIDGGVLFDGKKLFIQCLDKEVRAEVKKGDPVQCGYLVKWGHDGGTAVTVGSYMWREICSNGMWGFRNQVRFKGLHYGDDEDRKNLFIERVAAAFKKVRESIGVQFKQEMDHFKKWTKIKVNDAAAVSVAEKVFKKSFSNEQLDARNEMMQKRWEEVYQNTSDNKGNLWGLYNSFTELLTHNSAKTLEKSKQNFIENNRVQNWFFKSLFQCKEYAQKVAV